jgi:hypothetical protein
MPLGPSPCAFGEAAHRGTGEGRHFAEESGPIRPGEFGAVAEQGQADQSVPNVPSDQIGDSSEVYEFVREPIFLRAGEQLLGGLGEGAAGALP